MNESPPPLTKHEDAYALHSGLISKHATWNQLEWQAPVIALTAQAFLLTIAFDHEKLTIFRVFSSMMAGIIGFISWHLFLRHSELEVQCSKDLQVLETEVFGRTYFARPRVTSGGVARIRSRPMWAWCLFLFSLACFAPLATVGFGWEVHPAQMAAIAPVVPNSPQTQPATQPAPTGESADSPLLKLMLATIQFCAWPIVVVTVAIMFKERLRDLLGRLSKLNLPGGSAEFGQQLAKTEGRAAKVKIQQAKEITKQASSSSSSSFAVRQLTTVDITTAFEVGKIGAELGEIATHSPVEAIFQARSVVEHELIRISESTGLGPLPKSTSDRIRELHRRGVIDQNTAVFVRSFLSAGNSAAHGPGEVSINQALRMISIAMDALKVLKRLPAQ